MFATVMTQVYLSKMTSFARFTATTKVLQNVGAIKTWGIRTEIISFCKQT